MATPNKLTPEQRSEIAARYTAGEYTVDLARKYGVDSNTIKHWLKAFGIETRIGCKRILSPAQKADICARYIAGESTVALSVAFGVKPASIASIARRRGAQIRSRSEACRRLSLNEAAFSVVSDETAYWVGILMADGCVSKRFGTISFALKKSDKALVEAFRDFVGSNHKIRFALPSGSARGNGTGSYRIEFNSNKMAKDLARFGVVPRKSTQERVIGLESNPHFWRGMIDGDGYIGWTAPNPAGNRHPTLTLVGGIEIIVQFLNFVLSHTNDSVAPLPHRSAKSPSLYSLGISGTRVRQLLTILYDETCVALERKRAVALSIIASTPIPRQGRPKSMRDTATGRIVRHQ